MGKGEYFELPSQASCVQNIQNEGRKASCFEKIQLEVGSRVCFINKEMVMILNFKVG